MHALPSRRRTRRTYTGHCARVTTSTTPLAWKEERRLSQALTRQYDKVIFILEPSEPAKAAIGKYVTVFDYPDGRLAIRHNGVKLAYRTFDKVRQVDQGAIADNKHLGAVLAVIRHEQLRHGPQRRSGASPARSARCPSLQGRLSCVSSLANTSSYNIRSTFPMPRAISKNVGSLTASARLEKFRGGTDAVVYKRCISLQNVL